MHPAPVGGDADATPPPYQPDLILIARLLQKAQQAITALFNIYRQFIQVCAPAGFAFHPGAALAVVHLGVIEFVWLQSAIQAQRHQHGLPRRRPQADHNLARSFEGDLVGQRVERVYLLRDVLLIEMLAGAFRGLELRGAKDMEAVPLASREEGALVPVIGQPPDAYPLPVARQERIQANNAG